MSKSELRGVAYSYMRFSSPSQASGDSIRRQTEERDRWLARNPGVTLAPDAVYAELGTSSFRGRHRLDDKSALKQFIRAVESGRVKTGSLLIVESFDRLTREEFGEAAEFVLGLVNRGIRIVQLSPVEVILEKPVDLTKALILVVELTRGHGESKRKSDTIGAAWSAKRAACRESGKLVTKMCKSWLDIKGGKFVFKPGAQELIKRIFRLAAGGYGCRAIAQLLNKEKVPTWTGRTWYEHFIRVMLRGREVLGEYRQAKRTEDDKRELEPEPVLNYYPAAITEAEWQAANVARVSRDKRGGRPTTRSEWVNVFQGLLIEAKTGEHLQLDMRRGNQRVIHTDGYKRRGDPGVTFPHAEFERGILSELAEVNPSELFDKADGPDEVAELRARLMRMDAVIRALVDQFDTADEDDIPEISAKVRTKHAERKKLAEEFDRANANAASPLSAALGECRGLVEVLDTAKDVRDVRIRLRQAIVRTVEGIYCVFAGSGRWRIAAVQVWFKGDAYRNYWFGYEVGTGRAKGKMVEPRTLKAVLRAGDFDFRDRVAAARFERILAAAMEEETKALEKNRKTKATHSGKQ